MVWPMSVKVLRLPMEPGFAVTGAKGIGVIIEAKHLCMMMRGVEKQNSTMTTSVMLGLLREDPRTRAEFLSLVKG